MKDLTKEEDKTLTEYVQSVYTPKDYPFDYMKLLYATKRDFVLYKNFGGTLKDFMLGLITGRIKCGF